MLFDMLPLLLLRHSPLLLRYALLLRAGMRYYAVTRRYYGCCHYARHVATRRHCRHYVIAADGALHYSAIIVCY